MSGVVRVISVVLLKWRLRIPVIVTTDFTDSYSSKFRSLGHRV